MSQGHDQCGIDPAWSCARRNLISERSVPYYERKKNQGMTY